jgi:iron complex transport system substrate-binding protein
LGVVLLWITALPVSASQRIVSLNLCIDQLLVQLVARERIASLTYLSADPHLSAVFDELDGIHLNHGLAEELVPLQPDLILAGEFGAGEAVVLLRQLGYPVELLSWPRTLEEIAGHIQQLGRLVGAERRAEALVADIQQQLAALDAQVGQRSAAERPGAIWYSPNGVVVGGGTLEDELMTRAGYRNLAAEQGIVGFRQLDLEQLVMAAPEVMIVEGGYVESFSLAREYLDHPVLKRSGSRLVTLPAALSVCSAPVVAEVIRALQKSIHNQPSSDTGHRN